MRGRLAGAAVLAVLLSGCGGDPEPSPLPSGTPGGGAVTRPGATSAPGSPGAPGATGSAGAPAGTSPAPASDARARFRALVATWQGARSAFLAQVSSGRGLTLEAEKAAARTFLAAERRFASELVAGKWPAKARPVLDALRWVSVQMQSHLSAMAKAGSPSAFTGRLADYSVDVARDNAAVRAVDGALA
jgi:hypothetical protein